MTGGVEESTIGETPLVEVPLEVPATVYAKLEWFNLYDQPYGGGSVKTRIGKAMLDAAEDAGDLDGRTIIEPSSGNTGAALARIGGSRGYDVEVFMPEEPSDTKVLAIEHAGGTVHRSETYERMIQDCASLVERAPDRYYQPNQYENPANPGIHEEATGAEIWQQTDGDVTHFVAGIGTGGTITGVGRALDERGDAEIVGFEPERPTHGIHGLKYSQGPPFDPAGVLDESVLDRERVVSTRKANRWVRRLHDRLAGEFVRIRDPGQHDPETVREHLRVDGHFTVGPSSGAAIAAAYDYAIDVGLDAGDVVVVPVPDRGDRYTEFPLLNRTPGAPERALPGSRN